MIEQPTETVKPMTVVEFDVEEPCLSDETNERRVRMALVEREQLLRENAARLDNIQRIARANEDGSRLPVEAPVVAD